MLSNYATLLQHQKRVDKSFPTQNPCQISINANHFQASLLQIHRSAAMSNKSTRNTDSKQNPVSLQSIKRQCIYRSEFRSSKDRRKKKTSHKEMPQENRNHFKSPPFHTQMPKKIRSLQRKTPISKRKGTGKRRLKGEKKILLTLKQKQGSKASERQQKECKEETRFIEGRRCGRRYRGEINEERLAGGHVRCRGACGLGLEIGII